MFYQKLAGGIPFFVFSQLESFPGFVHLVTSRNTFSSFKDASGEQEVAAGAEKLMQLLGLPCDRLVLLKQAHSSRSLVLDSSTRKGCAASHRGPFLAPADGAIVLRRGLFPAIRTADCLPVIVADPENSHACVFHAGWRGTCGRLVEKGLQRFFRLCNSRPHQLTVALGPCIRRCCYEVGPEVRLQFRAQGHRVSEIFEDDHLDLVRANLDQIRRKGIENIVDSGLCTSCRNDLFYSYRREKTECRLLTIAGFRD